MMMRRVFYANLVARGLVALGAIGGINLAIYKGYTERLGRFTSNIIDKLKS